jgi:hypothetical protein
VALRPGKCDGILSGVYFNCAEMPGGLGCMTEGPAFQSEKNNAGRWSVAIATGNGPDSHVGDFVAEEETQHWIAKKSKYWPGKPDAPK